MSPEIRSERIHAAYVACLRAIHAEQLRLDELSAWELLLQVANHCEMYRTVIGPGRRGAAPSPSGGSRSGA